jgi:CDP-glucose 4,6-dehydratase
VEIDRHFWSRRRVLVTGHSGFKGAWLSLWLQSMGADLSGLSAGEPKHEGLYELAGLAAHIRELRGDTRDGEAMLAVVGEARPEVIFHLAGQPLVRRSLQDPVATFAVNLMGTVNLLEAVRIVGEEVRAVVVVTSDKCYENPSAGQRSFAEGDPLGGADPYSSSKACAELVASAYRRSYFGGEGAPRIATARAGNVIGGGDWGEDRLVADSVRAVEAGRALSVRNPDAVRPWQHVLNPLAGYLRLAEELFRSAEAARAWNFGPEAGEAQPVSWIVERLGELWDGNLKWELDRGANPPEAPRLTIDSSSARRELGWSPSWDLEDALELVVEWHRAHLAGEDMREVSLAQILRFA